MYGLIKIIFFVVLTIFLDIVFFLCLCLKYFTTFSIKEKNEGIPFDHVNNKIKTFSFKPKYVR